MSTDTEAGTRYRTFQFHTYSLLRVKPVALAFRGLDNQPEPRAVLDELRAENYKVVVGLYTSFGSATASDQASCREGLNILDPLL